MHIGFSGTLICSTSFGYVWWLGIQCYVTHIPVGAAEDLAHSSLRFGIGRFTTEAEIDYVVDKAVSTVQKLRDMRYYYLLPSLNVH